MNFLPEEDVWDEGIYQIETNDDVVGGPGGIDNIQATQLARRTKYLKARIGDVGELLDAISGEVV